jgi:hypothetical protein
MSILFHLKVKGKKKDLISNIVKSCCKNIIELMLLLCNYFSWKQNVYAHVKLLLIEDCKTEYSVEHLSQCNVKNQFFFNFSCKLESN